VAYAVEWILVDRIGYTAHIAIVVSSKGKPADVAALLRAVTLGTMENLNMDYDLISEEEYAALPEDDEQCFVEYEAICRRNMTRMIDDQTSHEFDREVRSQYMATISAVAAECNIPNINIPSFNENNFTESFNYFCLAVQGEVARIRIRGRRVRSPFSVQLAINTRTKIEHHISRLRDAIENSDLSNERKRALDIKLDQLVEELGNRRLSLAKTMAVLSAVMVGLASGTTIASDGPAAVTHIMKLIGIDKESEDAAALRLAPPQKALPAPAKKPIVAPQTGNKVRGNPAIDLDDEIPF
jgi:hypothetical protein